MFDPFNLIAYVGELPNAYAFMAASRLWVAGLGMFLLARAWGLGPWGRWFAGLTFPLTGFLVVWLLFPVTNAAVWTPWVFLASDRVFARPTPGKVGALALCVGGLFVGGHIQTSAHVLLAVGLDAGWRVSRNVRSRPGPFMAWSAGVALGLTIAAVSIVPLWSYLGKSPVWADREAERRSPWSVGKPRILDAVCTVVPDAFGSQRRGEPNLARAIGVHNYNESAGGFAGLATLLWLVPQAWAARRSDPRVRFLAGLAAVGFLGAFGFPPVANALRAVPILNVTDLRRLTLWVAFASPLLGGIGLDQLAFAWPKPVARWWVSLGLATAAALTLGGFVVPGAEPRIRSAAERHYRHTASPLDGASAADSLAKADRQVALAVRHVPRVLWRTAAEIAALAALGVLAHRRTIPWKAARGAVLVVTAVELFYAGFGLNPAIDRRDDRPTPPVITALREQAGSTGRVVGLGQELLPNVAMRYGLADARNYDSVELTRNLDWFAPLFEPGGRSRTSRRGITWAGVVRGLDRLKGASVSAVVSAAPPPDGLDARVKRLGTVWVARLDSEPLATLDGEPAAATVENGRIDANLDCKNESLFLIRQTYDPGWSAVVDGVPARKVEPYRGAFLSVRLKAGRHSVALRYDPTEVRAACAASACGLGIAVALAAVSWRRPGGSFRFRALGLGRCRAEGLESFL